MEIKGDRYADTRICLLFSMLICRFKFFDIFVGFMFTDGKFFTELKDNIFLVGMVSPGSFDNAIRTPKTFSLLDANLLAFAYSVFNQIHLYRLPFF